MTRISVFTITAFVTKAFDHKRAALSYDMVSDSFDMYMAATLDSFYIVLTEHVEWRHHAATCS